MNYEHIISEMTWSYSRITSFESCKYKWLMKYIYNLPSKRLFFSDYGKFAHLIIEKFLKGELSREDAPHFYLSHFSNHVQGPAPNKSVHQNYFLQGLNYFSSISFPYRVLNVEVKVAFNVDQYDFIGFVDVVASDGGIIIMDNKSRNLRQRSCRKKPTKYDQELDRYLQQLYLYAIPINAIYGEPPKRLEFNLFRQNEVIAEDFRPEKIYIVKQWAVSAIEEIKQTTDWIPSLNYFGCRYLCDVSHHCEYFNMMER